MCAATTNKVTFPPVNKAGNDGLICYGGNLEPETLIEAYSCGIFPWYTSDTPILWWSPPERMIIKPSEFKPVKSLRKIIRSNFFDISFDTNFEAVIKHCAKVYRKDQDDTWLTQEMINAYIKLHQLGLAHSVEVYKDAELVGGLYGVSLGKAFFGESMFHINSNASKVAFYYLVELLKNWDFHFIDAQQNTQHLKSLGAYTIERDFFIHLLQQALKHKTHQGTWKNNRDLCSI